MAIIEKDRDVRDRLIRIETKLDNLGKIETQSNEAIMSLKTYLIPREIIQYG